MLRTLQTKYILFATALVATLLILVSTIFLYQFSSATENVRSKTSMQVSNAILRQLEKRYLGRTEYLADILIAPIYDEDMPGIGLILGPVLKSEEIETILVIDNEGVIIHDGEYDQREFEERLDNEVVLQAILEQRTAYVGMLENNLIVARPIMIGQSLVGAIYLEISLQSLRSDVSEVNVSIDQIKQDSLIQLSTLVVYFTVLIGLVAILIAAYVARLMVDPIKRLVDQANEIGSGNYLVDKGVRRNDELGNLANAIRDMGVKLKHRNEEVSFMAFNDSLTRLPNRLSFVKTLDQELKYHREHDLSLALLFIDLDGFKSINDNFGHRAGDYLLKEIAQRLQSCLRSSDRLVDITDGFDPDGTAGRIGGDEFLICLPVINDENQVEMVADRLVKIVREPVVFDNKNLLVAASIGIALYPRDASDADSLIKSADVAMYQSKAMGKNTYSFSSPEQNRKVSSKVTLERHLRDAITDPDQHFEIWLQPLVNIEKRCAIGAEALIRWCHPELGLIPPGEFIPVAEESGMINDIGEWVLRHSFGLLHQWQQQWNEERYDDFILSINLSSRQLYSSDTLCIVSQLLEQYRLQARNIKLEVTESMLLSDVDMASRKLQELRDLGIGVWLDDFGTGYSSLSYLNRFPVDGIKLDQSFISGIGDDKNSETLVRVIVALANECQLNLVVEGIESEHQADFIEKLGCSVGQGYLYARPMPAKDFSRRYLS